jgi:hypothetical protein
MGLGAVRGRGQRHTGSVVETEPWERPCGVLKGDLGRLSEGHRRWVELDGELVRAEGGRRKQAAYVEVVARPAVSGVGPGKS